MVDFPSILPVPTVNGYGYTEDEQFSRVEMEIGTARHRKQYTKVPTLFDIEFLFSDVELGLFEGWHNHKISLGMDRFNISLRNGDGMSTHDAQIIGGAFSVSNVSRNRWRVTTKLEVNDRPIAVYP